ncbi:MAG: DUF1330 domain-containing protein [Vicinamibacteria bacterium]|jgi:uncharacterized protein (DUF1330 family)|nr:DUF1330 domain-containing protein [Vicinamibacteria bacterium]
MPAYVVAEVEVQDPVAYEEYKVLAAASIAQYGGRYLARGGEVAALESEPAPKRIAILEFPTLERARQWFASPEYTRARGIRLRTASARLYAVAGVE